MPHTASVRSLLGRPHRLLPSVIQEIGVAYQQNQSCILLVPEQFTLQAELDLTRELNLPGFFDIQVLSPTRLTQRVFEAAGAPQHTRIDDRGKSMILRLLLDEYADRLQYYRNAAGSNGFLEKLSALIADMKSSDIAPEVLAMSTALVETPRLRQKLQDTALLYAAYEKRLAGRFADGEDLDQALDIRIADSGLFKNAHVWVYGFDMLTHSFSRRLLSIAGACTTLTIALVADDSGCGDTMLFDPALQSLQRFEATLEAQSIPFRRFRAQEALDASPAIRHLEQNLFSFPCIPYSVAPEGIALHSAGTPFAQVHHVAALALAEMRDNERSPSEMVIQYPAGGDWPRLLRKILPEYGVPVHVQEQRSAVSHPMIQMLLAALRCLSGGFRQDDVFCFLKSGFSPLSEEESFLLENYALAYGLSGSAWLAPLHRGNEEDCEANEPLRVRLMEPLLGLRTALQGGRSTESALRALYEFLLRLGIPDKLEVEQDRLSALGLLSEVSHSTQVWNALMEVFSQMHSLLPGRFPRLALVVQMLEAGLAATQLSALPAQAHVVTCGELGNLRAGRVKALFCLGLNDMGAGNASSSLLDDRERSLAQEHLQAHIGMQDAHRQMLRRLDLLNTLSLPTDSLYVGFTQSDGTGHALRPDIVVLLLQRAFPKLREEGGVLDDGLLDMLSAPLPALSALSLKMREAVNGEPMDSTFQHALQCLSAMPEMRGPLKVLRDTLHVRFSVAPLPVVLAGRLLGDAPFSVSRLESFAACPFQHYVSYLLRPQPRKVYGIYRQDLGVFYHDALMAYAQLAVQTPGWPTLTRSENDVLLENAAAPYLEQWTDGPLQENARAQAIGREVLRVAKTSAWALCHQATQSDFRPRMLELAFGMEPDGAPPLRLPLPDGGDALLRGRIDRIDVWESTEGEAFLSVLDYKATRTSPKLSAPKLCAGLQLQLPLYLDTALSMRPDTQPAGMYYFQLHDPIVESYSTSPEEIASDLAKEMEPSGLTIAQENMNAALPAGVKRKVSPEQLTNLLTHSRKKAGQWVGQMRDGVIDAKPTGDAQRLPCSYCTYRAICGLDPMLPGAQSRVLPSITMKQAVEQGFPDVALGDGEIRF